MRLVAGDHEPFDGVRIVATPGHTPGHQSLVVDQPDGPTVIAGQACYTMGEWIGDPDALEGRSSAPDVAAYDRSIERLRASIQPVSALAMIAFIGAGEPTAWQCAGSTQPGYPSQAVLGGELAVPCTCNPLQQG